ncbi:MAG: phosphatidic acid phosphatase [Clostridia bacterium]|nr:phosphatidic acid phosphatase [Clostridia bacterium]
MFRILKQQAALLNTPQWKHMYLLLYWIVYLVGFQIIEHINFSEYHILHCSLDDIIPFNEYFVIPYVYWFLYMGTMAVYTVFFDKDAFAYYMKMVIVTSLVAMTTYCIYPNGLELRPGNFERDNIFTRFVAFIYSFDTSTNVCPSLHVSGTLLTLFTSRRCDKFDRPAYKVYFSVTAILICMSTVFLKQHSVIDVFWGLVSALAADFAVNYKQLKIKLDSYKRVGDSSLDKLNN